MTKDSTLKNITKTWMGTEGSVEERATNIYKKKQFIFSFGNMGSAFSAIPCIWFVFSSKEHFCQLILIADPAQWRAYFTTETNAWVFAWQELCTWLIARFPVTQLIAQLSATMVDARPFAWFLQQQYKYGWFIWSYLVSQFDVLHNKIVTFRVTTKELDKLENILRGCATAGFRIITSWT